MSTCTASSGFVGAPQTFNMTTTATDGGANSTIVHERFFGVQIDHSDTLQFSFAGENTTEFQVFLANETSGNTDSLPDLIQSSSNLNLLINATDLNHYAGEIPSAQGFYIFVFSVPRAEPGNAVDFVLQDAETHPQGTISMAQPSFEDLISHSENGETGGPAWWKVPLTIYSNVTTSVNMTIPDIPQGAWVKFVPSYLQAVGPDGANVTMYLWGVTPISGPVGQDNIWMFIYAQGPNGVVAETYLPLESPGSSPPRVIQSQNLSSVKSWGNFGPPTNSSSGGSISLVYDPTNASVNNSLSLNLTIAGILQDGKVAPLPNGLHVYWPDQIIQLSGCCAPYVAEYDNFTGGPISESFAYTIPADYPFYFDIGFNVTALPVGSQYTLVLDGTANGEPFVGYATITVALPIMPV